MNNLNHPYSKRKERSENKWERRRKSIAKKNSKGFMDMNSIQIELEKIEKFVKEKKFEHEEIQYCLNSQINDYVNKTDNFSKFQEDVFDASRNNFLVNFENKESFNDLRNSPKKLNLNKNDSLEKNSEFDGASVSESNSSSGYSSKDKENSRTSVKNINSQKPKKRKQKKSKKSIVYKSLDPRKLEVAGFKNPRNFSEKSESTKSCQKPKKAKNFSKKLPGEIAIVSSNLRSGRKKNTICDQGDSSSFSNRPDDLNTEMSEFTSNKKNHILVPLLEQEDSLCQPHDGGNKKNNDCYFEEVPVDEVKEGTEEKNDEEEEETFNLGLNFVKKNESFFDKKMRRIEDDYKDLMQELKEQYRFEVNGLKAKLKEMKKLDVEKEKKIEALEVENSGLKEQYHEIRKTRNQMMDENEKLKSEMEIMKKEFFKENEDLKSEIKNLKLKIYEKENEVPQIETPQPHNLLPQKQETPTPGKKIKRNQGESGLKSIGKKLKISEKNLKQILQNELFLQEKESIKRFCFSLTQKTKPKSQDPKLIEPKGKRNPPYRLHINPQDYEYFSNEYYQNYLSFKQDRNKLPSKRVKDQGVTFRLYKDGSKCIKFRNGTIQDVKKLNFSFNFPKIFLKFQKKFIDFFLDFAKRIQNHIFCERRHQTKPP